MGQGDYMGVEDLLPKNVCELKHRMRDHSAEAYRCCDSRECGYKVVNTLDVMYCIYAPRPEEKPDYVQPPQSNEK